MPIITHNFTKVSKDVSDETAKKIKDNPMLMNLYSISKDRKVDAPPEAKAAEEKAKQQTSVISAPPQETVRVDRPAPDQKDKNK